MPAFTVNIDTITHVFTRVEDKLIGQQSQFTTVPHPGTDKTIQGWKWDGRSWPEEGEFRAAAFAPSIWDPTLSGIDEADLQSGFGDNEDLLLLDIQEVTLSGVDVWAPQLQHGYFYVRDEEWFLFSDSHLTEYFTTTGVDNGQQVLTLTQNYKPTIPIFVRNWQFNRVLARHEVRRNFRKKVAFTVSGEEPEFILDTSFRPPQLRLNGEYNELVGGAITLTVSGTADPAAINALDLVGVSDGNADQSFQMTLSPVDPSQDVEVWSWLDPNVPTEWTVIDPLTDFSVSGVEVKMDKDRGTLTFGDHDALLSTGMGIIPTVGSRIGVYYTTAVAAQYEPEGTLDDILAYSAAADTNPVQSSASRGFVQVTTQAVDPASITLTSTLPQVNPFIIQLGNNIGEMIAEVRSADGDVLEGQEVTFQILDPQVGTFGATATETTAITGSDGNARTFYNSPVTVQGLGRASTVVSHSGGDTVIDVAGVVPPTTVSGIFLYKVHAFDEVLGIAEADEATYYTDYLDDENIVSGVQATQAFEEQYRTNNDLLPIETYGVSEIAKGKKTLMLTTRAGTMNPHTGFIEPGILVPLHPSSVENIGTASAPILRMTYSGTLLDLPGSSDTKAYFAVGDAQTSMQAFVTNSRTNRRIFSNVIELEVQVPDSVNGTFFCDVLNDIPAGLLTKHKDVFDISDGSIDATSGIADFYRAYLDERDFVHVSGIYESYVEWFRRTRRGDTVSMTIASLMPPTGTGDPTLSGLDVVEPMDCPAEIPLGWRLKSTGVTVASVMDQITYLNPNDILPSGHFSV